MISINAPANPSMLSTSRFVVGSSSASIPQLLQNVSAKDSLIIIDDSTFYPAEHLPLISSSVSSAVLSTIL